MLPGMLNLLLTELAGEHPADRLAIPVLLLVLVPRHLMDIFDVSREVCNAVVFVATNLTHVNTTV